MSARFDEEDGFRAYLNQLQHYEPLDRKTEMKLARRWVKKGDQDAAQKLVASTATPPLRTATMIVNTTFTIGMSANSPHHAENPAIFT